MCLFPPFLCTIPAVVNPWDIIDYSMRNQTDLEKSVASISLRTSLWKIVLPTDLGRKDSKIIIDEYTYSMLLIEWIHTHTHTHTHTLLLCASVIKNLPANAGTTGDIDLIPGSGRSPGGGDGNPLQCSCLENPIDRGAWQATVPRVTKELDTTAWQSTRAYICPGYYACYWKVWCCMKVLSYIFI